LFFYETGGARPLLNINILRRTYKVKRKNIRKQKKHKENSYYMTDSIHVTIDCFLEAFARSTTRANSDLKR
jgi:hypothetical protein